MELRRHGVRPLLAPAAVAALAWILMSVAGCGMSPRPRPPVGAERVPPVEEPRVRFPVSESLDEAVRGRIRDADWDEARRLLDEARENGRESPALRRHLAGEIQEAEGDLEGALVSFLRVPGSEGGPDLAPTAWESVARVEERAGGDPLEIARARLRAWESTGPNERSSRRDDRREAAARALEGLGPVELRDLLRDPALGEGRGAVRAALARRATRDDPAVTIAAVVPLTGRFENFGHAFLLGVRLALADRDSGGAPEEPFPRLPEPRPVGPLPLVVPRPEPPVIRGAEEFRASLREAVAPVPPPAPAEEPEAGLPVALPPAPDPGERPRVRLVVHDTEGDLFGATRAVRSAIREDGADAIVGPLRSLTSIAAGSVAEAYGVPLLAPVATDPVVGRIGPHVLTLAPDPSEFAVPLAKFSVGVLGNVRHGVLVPQDGVSPAFEAAFRTAVEENGGQVTVSIAFDPEESDFRRLLERFIEAKVDAVYVPGEASSLGRLAPQLDFYDFPIRILGNGGWADLRILDPGNLALEGAVLAIEDADDPDSRFTEHLRSGVWRESREELSRFHLSGYRTMSALLLAIDEGARDGTGIAETLRRRGHWPKRPAGEGARLVTFRDGVLGPASWAVGFDLVAKLPPEPPEEEEEGTVDEPVAEGDAPAVLPEIDPERARLEKLFRLGE